MSGPILPDTSPPVPPERDLRTAVGTTPHRRRRGRGFRRRDALHAYSMHYGPNMTPMVDVVMVILIFFMASAAFAGSEWFLRAAIPIVPGSRPNPNADPLALPPARLPIRMEVDSAGVTRVSFLNVERGTMDEFLARVRALPAGDATEGIEVLINADAGVPYRDVIRAHEACEAAGIRKIGIGVGGSAAQQRGQ